jgi:hypothetical protein
MNKANFAEEKNGKQWHALEHEELLRTLETPTDQGLSSPEAERRSQSVGLNQLEEATPVSLSEWMTVIALALVPAITEEMTKAYLRWREAGPAQESIEKRYAQA